MLSRLSEVAGDGNLLLDLRGELLGLGAVLFETEIPTRVKRESREERAGREGVCLETQRDARCLRLALRKRFLVRTGFLVSHAS